MENIAPLAKVLAEANGLDWKTIKGTGAGGQITEDDVLSHLALIMSGEVEPPSTPVDPEPSPAELAAAASPELLSRAGVDSDLTDLLKMQEDARAALKAQETPAAAPASDDFELDDEPAAAPVHTETPAAAGAGAGAVMGGLLSSLYHKDQAAEPAAPAAPAYSEPAPVPAFNVPGSTPAASYSEPEPVTPAYSEPAYSEPEVHVPPVSAWAAPAAPTATYEEPAAPAYSAPSYSEPEPVAPAYSEPAAPAYSEPVTPAYSEPSYSEAAAPAYAAGTVAQNTAGVYLRRDADVSAAEEARNQLGEVLGEFPMTLLVARAAQKAAASLGLSSVAVANSSGEALNADLSNDLRASVSGLRDAATGRSADLLVINAGDLDLDELHYAHSTTLSLGRIQDGKAALSLSGNVDAAQGARFLADVAALLATPVKLLV